jgi:hypothetical protein
MLRNTSFPWAALRPIFEKYFPMPQSARDANISEADYYAQLDALLPGWDPNVAYDPVALTDEIWERIVTPTLEAGAMFTDHPFMTRLYTLLSPEEMTEDPVFAFNAELPDVSNLHQASMVSTCEDDYPFELQLEDGRRYRLKTQADWTARVLPSGNGQPAAARVEIIREEGQPEIRVDNTKALTEAAEDELDDGGCSAGGKRRGVTLINAMFMILLIAAGRRVMRPRS